MNSRIDHITKGLISLAVILMFTVALIAGQARANLPAEASAGSDFGQATRMKINLDTESLQQIESMPRVVDTLRALPIDIELRMDGLTLRTDTSEEAGPGHLSVQ